MTAVRAAHPSRRPRSLSSGRPKAGPVGGLLRMRLYLWPAKKSVANYADLIIWRAAAGPQQHRPHPDSLAGNSCLFPGRSAARSVALQTRDRNDTCFGDPGSAVHHCASLVLHRARDTGLHFRPDSEEPPKAASRRMAAGAELYAWHVMAG